MWGLSYFNSLPLLLNEKSARAAGGTQYVVVLCRAMWFILVRTGCLAPGWRVGGAEGVEVV